MIRLAALCVLGSLLLGAQEKKAADSNFVIVLARGPKWLAGKPVSEQPLREHGRYLQGLMEGGTLVLAGPFLDDSGGLILLKTTDEAEAQKIAHEDPAVRSGIMTPTVHPFKIVFDSATGTSPFKKPTP
ncbi:MAG: YciI family protein [Bryobacteraceae bacterium]